MNITKTKVGGIRLNLEHWLKLRALMRHYRGRAWLEKLIDSAHKKMVKNEKESP